MKNQEDIRSSIIKGAAVLLVALSLLPFGEAKAQTVQSAQYKLSSCDGTDVVVRESAAGVPVVSHTQVGHGVHFMYGDFSGGSAKEFSISDTMTLDAHRIQYVVKDMRVVGGMCYFCGVRKESWTEPDFGTTITVSDSIGILGRFSLDPSGFGAKVSYDLKHFHGTKCLNRMATYVYGLDTVVGMIGVVNSSASQSCLVVASVTYLNTWKFAIFYSNAIPQEVFTDIAVDSARMTVASYQKSSAGRDYFCLRTSRCESIHMHDDYTEFNTLYKYYTNPSGGCVNLSRSKNAGVRLCAVPWTEKVYAAFTCSVVICDTVPNNTALCEIGTSNMNQTSVQIVRSPDTLLEIKYLYGTRGNESTGSVALLHLTNDHFKTVVEYPHALVSSYAGTGYTVLRQSHRDSYLNSISAHNGNDIRFGGMLDSASPIMTYLQEMQPSLADGSLCMENDDCYVTPTNMLQAPTPETDALQSYYTVPSQSLVWATKVATTTSVSVGQVCIY